MSPAHVRAALLAAPHATASPAPSLAAALDTARRRAPRVDPWFGFDKVQHFTFSFLVTVGGQYALTDKAGIRARGALPASVAAGAAVGLAKEVYDARRRGGSGFSRRDLAWDALGLGAAALFIVL